jgi:hypothetical protein
LYISMIKSALHFFTLLISLEKLKLANSLSSNFYLQNDSSSYIGVLVLDIKRWARINIFVQVLVIKCFSFGIFLNFT